MKSKKHARQRRYQQRHKKAGLCLDCPEPVAEGSTAYCTKHLLYHREAKRRAVGCKSWVQGMRGRPPIQVGS